MHGLSTGIVHIIRLFLNKLTGLSTIHRGYPRIHNPQGRGSVDCVREPRELSTVIHSAAQLLGMANGQKNFYPFYPLPVGDFPHAYPQKSIG
jgi:hypothetical protein